MVNYARVKKDAETAPDGDARRDDAPDQGGPGPEAGDAPDDAHPEYDAEPGASGADPGDSPEPAQE
jgi:hypothetical protein